MIANLHKIAFFIHFTQCIILIALFTTIFENKGYFFIEGIEYPLWPFIVSQLFCSAIQHFCLGFFVFHSQDDRQLFPNPYRWIEYTFSSSIMIWIITALCNVQSAGFLVSITLLNAAIMPFGYIIEKQRSIHIIALAWLLHAFLWTLIGFQFYHELKDSEAPTMVYFIIPTMFILFSFFGVANLYVKDTRTAEWVYSILSLTTKSTLTYMILGGALRDRQE